MSVNSVGYNPNIYNNVGKPTFKTTEYRGDSDKKHEEKHKQSTVWTGIAVALFVGMVTIAAITHIKHRNQLGELVKSISEKSGNELKNGLKKYPCGSRKTLVDGLVADGEIKQAKVEDIDRLIKKVAAKKDIKSFEEETFGDKLDRWLDSFF